MLAPFAAMLLGIALFPLISPRMWEKNIIKIIFANILALPTISLLADIGYIGEIKHQILFDYLPFIILIGTLYIVTGSINIRLNFAPSPRNNTIVLLIGYALASLMGTTGAALLLVRPLLAMNRERKDKSHLMLFLIALVANCGGLLTPLGDPPLFMLFLLSPSIYKTYLFLPWAPRRLHLSMELLCYLTLGGNSGRFYFGGSKITAVTAAAKLKDICSLEEKL